MKIGRTHETNLDSLKKLAKDEDPTVNVVEKRQTQSRCKRSQQDVKFFVVDTEVESVLSGNSCLKLGLLTRVYQLTDQELPSKRVEFEDFPELFTGLGCLPDTYHIEPAEELCL